MKRNSLPINNPGRAAMLVLVAGMTTLMTGCTTANIKVSPTANIQNVSDKKIPLSVGLMLDDRFCTNRVFILNRPQIPLGPVLKQQSISLCEQTFKQVAVSTDGVVPAGVSATLTPEVHRCGVALHGTGSDFTLLLQWTLRTADNRNILWMTTVGGHANENPDKVYQLLFDDLATKSYRAFQASLEIKRLITKRSGTSW
jgi:hypothetical protein